MTASNSLRTEIVEDCMCAISAGSSGHTTTRMSASPTEIKPLNRSSIVGPAHHRPRPSDLIQTKSTVENVPFMEAENLLEVEGRQSVHTNYAIGEPWREFVDDAYHAIHKRVFEGWIRPAAKSGIDVIRSVLHEELDHMLSRGGNSGIESGWNRHLYDGPTRRLAHGRLSCGIFELCHAVFEVDGSAMLWTRGLVVVRGHTSEVGELIDSEVDLESTAVVVGVGNMSLVL
mmetsp:Transcript_66/g.95  ORF Transcript_66/g.95 Transcript_66/m.95 type:complete len:230 (-) Transcript_66:1077-1766(-)